MKKPCGNAAVPKQNTREILATMWEKLTGEDRLGYAKESLRKQRYSKCTHASKCGRMCPNLIKDFGIEEVFCRDIATGKETPLYEALENPDFECPIGLF
ncbi:hypothetical protein LCGC14_0297550 [marine sediment metagenome]|uniref:Uncharacterized protein n=1 Tax=marine sediment metagenome TaxID=412755 RepID=A0A0F9U834_9ZZZZ